jgi:tetratricopeptide (TPR) repeat protein
MDKKEDEEKFEVANDKNENNEEKDKNENNNELNNNNNNLNQKDEDLKENETKNETNNSEIENNNNNNNNKNENSSDEENFQKNNQSDDEENNIELSQEEKDSILQKIIDERKQAGELYKNQNYLEALNIYSLLIKEAKRAKLKDQLVILYCNKGICFNKLLEKEKALESFSKALEYDNNYSKALCNRMLLYNSKGDYIEAYEDFKKLKEIDEKLWNNYSNMEYSLQASAEMKKKQMTNEMLGKLKDLGNSILGNFGISLDNFKMTPNGQGGYSIQYNNNK